MKEELHIEMGWNSGSFEIALSQANEPIRFRICETPGGRTVITIAPDVGKSGVSVSMPRPQNLNTGISHATVELAPDESKT